MKKIAILQSNYIPWKGYFDMIHMVDEFILYDDMQYTKRDWRNRNQIIAGNRLLWLSIPVKNKGRFHQKINETQVADPHWAESHWKSIRYHYAKAACFHGYAQQIQEIYLACQEEAYLSRINYRFLKGICRILGISTQISWSSDYPLADGKTERLVSLVKSAGGDVYLSGPAARDYIEEDKFREAGVALEWMDYSGYPVYRQLSASFIHQVSILDLIFNEGPDAVKYMKSFQE